MIYIIEENVDRLGGVERIVSILANHFIENNKVKVISVYTNGNTPFFSYKENVEILYLSSLKFSKKKMSNKLKYLLLLKRIKNICNKINDNDTVIFGRVPVAIKFLPFINKGAKIIVRDAINIYDYSSIIKKMMKNVFPSKVNHFIVSSDESMYLYNNFFINEKVNMAKIYNPLGIKISKNTKYNYENKLIVSNGRFDTQKGFENLLKACKIVFKEHPDWKLRLIGNGPLKDSYVNIINSENLRKNVELVNSTKNIEKELTDSSIFVMTSRYEGYANSLVEALACGIPSISYNWYTGCEEIIKNNVNGLIVPLANRYDYYNGKDDNQNIVNLANAINYLIENKEVCIKMSQEAKKIVETRKAEKILELWEDLIDE